MQQEIADSVTKAELSEANAEASETSALESKVAAGESASNAAKSEEGAAKSAASASESAVLASNSADEANTSCVGAGTSADSASASATSAKEFYDKLVATGTLTLGIEHGTAFYGDWGNEAYLHSKESGNPHKTTAEQVGADAAGTAQLYYENATAYADQKIAELIDGAPTTLDTLNKIATEMAENEDVVEALNAAIGEKANQAELDTHEDNSVIHVTATDKSNWNGYEARIAALEALVVAIGYPYSRA